MYGNTLVTAQTGASGRKVQTVYFTKAADISKEYYLAILLDRATSRPVIVASTEGGVEIEKVAAETPEKILTEHVDPVIGLGGYQARKLAFGLGIGKGSPAPKESIAEFSRIVVKLVELFAKEDCSLCEINPLIVTKQGKVIALDSKINFDDNAAGRHKEWDGMMDRDEEDPVELEAKEAGLSYVALDGDIGCLVNGAGLAMATMDIIKHHGGNPANFLDVGGGATKEQVEKAFRMILSSPKVKGIFVNIFGGIMKCDVIAEGVVAATQALGLKVPLVVRLEGTNVERGKQILNESGLRIQAADGMADGAKKIVASVRG
jgi:succinyl-CoA synthetase beta subunit